MRATVKRILVVGAIATTGVFASVGTTHAAAAPRFTGHVLSGPLVASAKVVNSFIVPKGAKEGFSPAKLTVPDVTGTACAVTDYSFAVSNFTTSTQQLTNAGSPIANPIPEFTAELICADDGDVGGSFVLNLAANPKAKLTITLLP
jgi:hypothetical protein